MPINGFLFSQLRIVAELRGFDCAESAAEAWIREKLDSMPEIADLASLRAALSSITKLKNIYAEKGSWGDWNEIAAMETRLEKMLATERSIPSPTACHELQQIAEREQNPLVIEKKRWVVEYRNIPVYETEKWCEQACAFPAERIARRWIKNVPKTEGDEFRVVEVVLRRTHLAC